MAAWLLWVSKELQDSPVWGPYIASLPSLEECTCLLRYGPDAAPELQIPELMEDAEREYKAALEAHRRYFHPDTGLLGPLRLAERLEDTQWALCMVWTRSFHEKLDYGGLSLMVPYADLANHAPDGGCSYDRSKDRKRYELRLKVPLAKGEEATISCGDKPNMSGKTGGYGPNMMRSYGFVVPGNPSDRVELPNQSQLPWLKTEGLLTATGFTLGALPRYWLGDHFDGRLKYSRASRLAADRDPEEGLTLARRRCVLLSIDKWGKLWGGPLERAKVYLAEERGRVRKVQAAFEQALASLPTRIEEDEQLLADLGGGEAAPGRPLKVAAVRARLEHKRLLREGVRMMQLYDTWLAERIGRRARGRSRVLGAS